MRKFLTLLNVTMVLSVILLGCGATTTATPTESTDATTEYHYTTGTYFMWRQQVFDYFEALDFSGFAFSEARYYSDSEHPETFTVLSIDGPRAEGLVQTMFADFSEVYNMFPTAAQGFVEYEIEFIDANETLLVTIAPEAYDTRQISFLHLRDGIVLNSQQFPGTDFGTTFESLLNTLIFVNEA